MDVKPDLQNDTDQRMRPETTMQIYQEAKVRSQEAQERGMKNLRDLISYKSISKNIVKKRLPLVMSNTFLQNTLKYFNIKYVSI